MKFLNLFENDNYSDVPADVLGQLQGLVKREPNPAAQKKALQGHIDRYRSNQSKTKPQTALEKRKEDSKNLVASIDQRRQRAAGKEVQQPEAEKPSGALDLSGNKAPKMSEPNPKKEGQPSLDDLLGDITGEKKEPIESIDQISERHEETTDGILNERSKAIQEFKDRLNKSFDMEDEIDSDIKPYRDWIKSSLADTNDGSEESMRDQFVQLMALANTYDGRIRNGAGKRSMTFEDAQVLLDPNVQNSLLEGYGDGSPEQIEKFIN